YACYYSRQARRGFGSRLVPEGPGRSTCVEAFGLAMELPPPYVLHPANVNQRPALDVYLLARKHSSRTSRNPQRGKLNRCKDHELNPCFRRSLFEDDTLLSSL